MHFCTVGADEDRVARSSFAISVHETYPDAPKSPRPRVGDRQGKEEWRKRVEGETGEVGGCPWSRRGVYRRKNMDCGQGKEEWRGERVKPAK